MIDARTTRRITPNKRSSHLQLQGMPRLVISSCFPSTEVSSDCGGDEQREERHPKPNFRAIPETTLKLDTSRGWLAWYAVQILGPRLVAHSS
jgi:hypothetical protein